MAKKEKKISINKWESIMTSPIVTIPLSDAEDVEIVIQRTLPLNDVLQFVTDAVAACIDADTGAYTPEVLPFVVKMNVLTIYANFTMPANVEKQYDLIYNTDVVDRVMAHINKEQYGEIVSAINEKIEYECAIMTSAAVSQVNELASRMEEFAGKTQALFSDVSGDEVSALMHNLSSIGNVDERAMVHAVFEAQKEREATTSAMTAQDASSTLEPIGEKILAFPHSEDRRDK